MGRPRKIFPPEIKPEAVKVIGDVPELVESTTPANWFILQGFSFEGVMYNRGEEIPGNLPKDFMDSLYERKYIGKITPTGVEVFSKPVVLSSMELTGLQKLPPSSLKSYITARNIATESLEKLIEVNKLNPESAKVVLERLTDVRNKEQSASAR